VKPCVTPPLPKGRAAGQYAYNGTGSDAVGFFGMAAGQRSTLKLAAVTAATKCPRHTKAAMYADTNVDRD